MGCNATVAGAARCPARAGYGPAPAGPGGTSGSGPWMGARASRRRRWQANRTCVTSKEGDRGWLTGRSVPDGGLGLGEVLDKELLGEDELVVAGEAQVVLVALVFDHQFPRAFQQALAGGA